MVDDFAIAEAMIDRGGGFVNALGKLWILGDPENRRRIVATWPEYWAKYRAMETPSKRSSENASMGEGRDNGALNP